MLNVDESGAVIADFLARPDEESYSAMFRLVSPRVFCYFRLRGCSRDVSEDLTQEVMLTVYRQSRRLRNPDMFYSWLFRIARNTWLQHIRQQQRRVQAAGLGNLVDELCAAGASSVETSCLVEWLGWLKPDERELVVLRYLEGFEYHEMATMLNMPVGTVQWKVFQLKRTLADRLEGRPA